MKSRFGKAVRYVLRRRPWKRRIFIILVSVLVALAIIGLTFVSMEVGTRQQRAAWAANTPYWVRVRKTMERNFDAYWKACAGRDEYDPVTKKCDEWLHVGATAVDSIDTLLIMGLKRQYRMVRAWAAGDADNIAPFRVAHPRRIFVFEQIIRTLGGLTSAYALTNDDMWLKRAREFADAVLPAWKSTRTRCPLAFFTIGTNETESMYGRTGTADAGTSQLEFRALAALSHEPKYAEGVDACARAMVDALPKNDVVTDGFDPENGRYVGSLQTMGAAIDSFVEYLLKVWLAFGKKDNRLRDAFVSQVNAVLDKLVIVQNGTAILGTSRRGQRKATEQMEHLACFFPGAVALAYMHGAVGEEELAMAKKLTRSCYGMVAAGRGLAPEWVALSRSGKLVPTVTKSILRPEVIESVYMMWKVTGDEMYRAWARDMWDGMERVGMLPNGLLSSVDDVQAYFPVHSGKLHSFVLAETLKYFYLIFKDGNRFAPGLDIDLRKMVFTTEAHPVPIFEHPPGDVFA